MNSKPRFILLVLIVSLIFNVCFVSGEVCSPCGSTDAPVGCGSAQTYTKSCSITSTQVYCKGQWMLIDRWTDCGVTSCPSFGYKSTGLSQSCTISGTQTCCEIECPADTIPTTCCDPFGQFRPDGYSCNDAEGNLGTCQSGACNEDLDYIQEECTGAGHAWENADSDINTPEDNCIGDDPDDDIDYSETICRDLDQGYHPDQFYDWKNSDEDITTLTDNCCGDDTVTYPFNLEIKLERLHLTRTIEKTKSFTINSPSELPYHLWLSELFEPYDNSEYGSIRITTDNPNIKQFLPQVSDGSYSIDLKNENTYHFSEDHKIPFILKSDLGQLTSDKEFACVKETDGHYYWHGYEGTYGDTGANAEGSIFQIGSFDIMSDGTEWIACDALDDGTGSFDGAVKKAGESAIPSSQGEHEYICYYDPEEEVEHFGECSGGVDPDNSNLEEYGTNHETGEKINLLTETPDSSILLEFDLSLSSENTIEETFSVSADESPKNLGNLDAIFSSSGLNDALIQSKPAYVLTAPSGGVTWPYDGSCNSGGVLFSTSHGTKILITSDPSTKDSYISAGWRLSEDIFQVFSRDISEFAPAGYISVPVFRYIALNSGVDNCWLYAFGSKENIIEDTNPYHSMPSPGNIQEQELIGYVLKEEGTLDEDYNWHMGYVTDNPAYALRLSVPNEGTTASFRSSSLVNKGVIASPSGGAAGGVIAGSLSSPIYASTSTSGTKFVPTETFYCTEDYEWIDDLDSVKSNGLLCEIKAGFEWTGSLCCGDDPADTYNDIDAVRNDGSRYPKVDNYGVGGCFRSSKVDSNERIYDNSIIENPNFEADDSDWETREEASIDEGVFIDSDAHIQQDISYKLYPGAEYELSAYIYASDSPTKISLIQGGETYKTFELTDYSETVKKTFTAPTDTSDMQVRIFSGGPNKISLDSFNINFLEKSMMNYEGEFYGCSLSSDEIKRYKDNNGNNLTANSRNLSTCSVKGDFFCSPEGDFSNESIILGDGTKILSKERNYTKSSYQGGTGCCNKTSCWNGTSCVLPHGPGDAETYNGYFYRCVDGDWTSQREKRTWNSKKSGFCDKDTQCLVDPEGKSENDKKPESFIGLDPNEVNTNPVCIDSGQYIDDHYCEDGNWTSRTKMIANALLDLTTKDNEFVLSCGDYDTTLNSLRYASEDIDTNDNVPEQLPLARLRGKGTGGIGGGYICPYLSNRKDQAPCVNNFCVLKNTDNVIFGTSLNQPIDIRGDYSFLKALDMDGISADYCDEAYLKDEGNDYFTCRGDERIWYNNKTNIVLFSKQGIDMDPTFLESLWDLITAPITAISNQFTTNPPVNDMGNLDFEYAKDIKDFNKIFRLRRPGKKITGVQETIGEIKSENIVEQKTVTAVNYEGFTTNICPAVERAGLYCNKTNQVYLVISENEEHAKLWPQLTTSLRVS
ncbi:hypothetical protein GF336_07090 [Candidatus Woesearchaeota archaeon]|nr:hypothetical protein [Candidatus Woesearchaeota archaeon]